jgi:hypothetical protein
MRVWTHIILAILLVAIIITPLASADNPNITQNNASYVTIDPVESYVIGDIFFINGTTNLPVTEKLVGTITTTIFTTGDKSGTNYPYAILPDIPITSTSSGINQWSVNGTDIAINELPVGWSPYIISVCPSSDDTSPECAYQTFNISAPANSFFTIDPVGSHYRGDVFFVNGTTNMPVSKRWIGWIFRKNGNADIVGIIIAPGVPGLSAAPESSGITRWSVNVTNVTRNLGTGEYAVVVGINHVASKTVYFSLLSEINGTGEPNISLIQPKSQSPSSIESATRQTVVPSATRSSPLPIICSITAILAILIARIFRQRE